MWRRLTAAPWGIVTVGAIGLAVRLVFATVLVPQLAQDANVVPDPDCYADLAASLIDRGELGFNPPGASPTSVRGPAFPLWLAIGMLIGGRSQGWISFWASVPGLIAAVTMAGLLGRSHGRFAGLAGGLLCAAHPLACFVSARTLADEFYGAALFCGLAAWWSSFRTDRTYRLVGWAALAGVLLAAASLTRATGVGVLIVLVAIGSLVRPRHLRSCAVSSLVAASLLAPWVWRTSQLVGRPMLVESLPGYNFWLGESAARYGFAPDFGRARALAHELMAREAGTQETTSRSFWYAALKPREARAFDEKLVHAGLRAIGDNPLSYAGRCASGLLWFWIRAETARRTVQYALVALPLLALGLFGLRRLIAWPQPADLPAGLVVAVVVFHVAVYAAIYPMARYSVQVYPLICYLAGAAFAVRPALPFRRVAHEQPTSKKPVAETRF